ncbi:MAG: hypothetical protein QXJ14_04540 [Candidatus Aenigmatarchaeota archaeon]
MRVLYITHCSRKKNKIKSKTFVENLYSATYIQRFIKKCKNLNLEWGILSDKYGIIFPHQKIGWYDLSPSYLLKNKNEAEKLIEKIANQLKEYDRVYFYHNPGRFHSFYKYLIKKLREKNINIRLISRLSQIDVEKKKHAH